MESMNVMSAGNKNRQPKIANRQKENLLSGILKEWYRLAAPPETSVWGSSYERERARDGRMGSITVVVFILFLLAVLLQAGGDHEYAQISAAVVGLVGCGLGLYLNRRGHVELAGVFI